MSCWWLSHAEGCWHEHDPPDVTAGTIGRRAATAKIVFLDAEFTGEHAYTTLVSLGLVTLEGEHLYVTVNDYARDQATDWLRENVLRYIDPRWSVSSAEAYQKVSRWLEAYSGGEPISLVSAGLLSDVILLYQLWRHSRPPGEPFHFLRHLPSYLNHSRHLDLNTLLFLAGVDPGTDRERFAAGAVDGRRHDALHDARVVRACFLRIVSEGTIPQLSAALAL